MFGAAIMRRCSLGALALVMLSGTPAQSAPQVTPNGFLVKFEVSVNAPAAKVTTHWLDRLVRGGTRNTHTQVMRRISRSTRGRAAAFARSCPMAAELSTLGSSTLLRVKFCGSQERSARYRRRVSLEP